MKTVAASLVILIALCVWGRQLWSPGGPGENELRDTTGVTVTVLKVRSAERGYLVQCRVENHGQKVAEQIVLNVALTDSTGRVLAVNPLAGVSTVTAATARDLAVFVPLRERTTNIQARAAVSLVRWQN